MPIYEYICNHCGERFERLIMKLAGGDEVTCPFCGSEEVERAVSPFASFGCTPTSSGFT